MGLLDMFVSNIDLGFITYIYNILNKITLVTYILSAYGLFLINTKLGEKYSWLSFIPVIQLYSYAKASGKSLMFILAYILSLSIGIILILVGAYILAWGVSSYGIVFLVLGLLLFFTFVIMRILLYHGISKRTGNTGWTTLGLLFVPFIMFPVVGYKLEDKSIDTSDKKSVGVAKEKIEL